MGVSGYDMGKQLNLGSIWEIPPERSTSHTTVSAWLLEKCLDSHSVEAWESGWWEQNRQLRDSAVDGCHVSVEFHLKNLACQIVCSCCLCCLHPLFFMLSLRHVLSLLTPCFQTFTTFIFNAISWWKVFIPSIWS